MALSSLFLLSAFLAFLVTPLTIVLAKRFLILDFPWRAHPAILHKTAIPRAGGLAIFTSIVITYLIFVLFGGSVPLDKHIVGILIAGLLVVSVGILDDKYDLNPYLRLVTNLLAAGIVVASGVGISWITNPFGGELRLDNLVYHFNFPGVLPFDLFAGPHSIVVLADIFAFVWIVWVMNALNWSSGVDGQLPGIATIGLIALGIAAQRYLSADPTQIEPAILAFIAAGAYAGFLVWSFYPQKIMPGYGGATLAGLILSSISILAGAKLATTGLLLIIPMVDGAWAVFRRILGGRSPVWGDKKHLHHQLLALGWKKWQVVLFYYALGGSVAFLALALDNRGRFFAIAVGSVIILAGLVTLAFFVSQLNKTSSDSRPTARKTKT